MNPATITLAAPAHDGLYHRAIYLPALSLVPVFGLVWSDHLREQAAERFIKEWPRHFLPRVAQIIELEVINGKPYKILAREPLAGTELDICYPFIIESKVVKTLYTNPRWDKHYTLDRSRYRSQ